MRWSQLFGVDVASVYVANTDFGTTLALCCESIGVPERGDLPLVDLGLTGKILSRFLERKSGPLDYFSPRASFRFLVPGKISSYHGDCFFRQFRRLYIALHLLQHLEHMVMSLAAILP